MELTQEHRSLIENIIRNNPRFSGNEDLVEDFCSETFKRSYSIVSTINDINNLEVYLNKVASSAILEVLKKSGRLRKSKDGYSRIQEISTSLPNVYDIDDSGDIIFDIPDPAPHFEEKLIQKEEIKTIRDIILKIDNQEKDKKFLDIFTFKYLKGCKQSEMASELGISQGEVSKRLSELIKKINDNLE